MKQIALLASGEGTNAEAIVQYFRSSGTAQVALILTNREDAGVRKRAERLGVPCQYFSTSEMREGTQPIALMQSMGIDLVVLAGYLVLITPPYLAAFPHRIINIHPALLPAFGGKGMYGHHVHEAVIASGNDHSGITIHLVDEHYDHGQPLLQAFCPVLPEDTPDSLAERIHELEHRHFAPTIEQYLLFLDQEAAADSPR